MIVGFLVCGDQIAGEPCGKYVPDGTSQGEDRRYSRRSSGILNFGTRPLGAYTQHSGAKLRRLAMQSLPRTQTASSCAITRRGGSAIRSIASSLTAGTIGSPLAVFGSSSGGSGDAAQSARRWSRTAVYLVRTGSAQLLLKADGVRPAAARPTSPALARRGLTMR